MNLTISKNANINYLARIVKIESFRPHPNADKLKLAIVDGCVIATSIDTEPGIFIYFPLECQINHDYLSTNNLYRNEQINSDKTKKGFFEENRRVRCISLRGIKSEGLIMPYSSLIKNKVDKLFLEENLIGTEFDTIDETLFVNKYVPKQSRQQGSGNKNKNQKLVKQYKDSIVENQFRFHDDTAMFKKNLHQFESNTLIHISQKFHGTSGIFCNLLVNKELSIYQKFLKFLGADIVQSEYKTFCSSRKVVKDPSINKKLGKGYYDVDIWNLALNVVKEYLQKGMTIYAEIVGYMPNGKMIQKDFDYGCQYLPEIYDYSTMTPQQMYDKNLFKIYVYRITSTNVDGKVYEMPAKQLQMYCKNIGLTPVIEEYYGTVGNFMYNNYLEVDMSTELGKEKFLELLSNKYLEKDCLYCNNKVPAEGVVIRIDKPKFEAYKLKSLAFYEKETKMLDEGIVDIETEES